ncbi:hypothetical protein TNCT_423881 [Trichonephila clavata]|uniref:Uncharacterized protein n=1 Tax=Trichonephila clavata TaxID=2740835 RepID=A0A8X6GDR5_TRICU|nr:hypothetical protein TNCT_423881 [Trichonephila clavata]
MTTSESESDDDMHLEQEERAPTPLPPPPQIDHYRSLILTANYAIVCLNICLDLQEIIKQIRLLFFRRGKRQERIPQRTTQADHGRPRGLQKAA